MKRENPADDGTLRRTENTSTKSGHRSAVASLAGKLPGSAGSALGVLLLLIIGATPAVADQHCSTSFTTLLVTFEGMLIGNGQLILFLLLVVGIVLWATDPVVPGQTGMGFAMVFIVFISSIAFVLGIDILTLTFETAGVAEQSCSNVA